MHHKLRGLRNYDNYIITVSSLFGDLINPLLNMEPSLKYIYVNTINDLSTHGEIMDLLHQPRDHRAKINVHAGGAYKNHEKALERMCINFKRLPKNVQCRLTLENDDRANLFSVRHIYENVSKKIGVPIVFDYHHHKFNTGGLSEQEALELAISTWPKDIKPIVHYSESKALHEENEKLKPQAHSDYINDLPDLYGNDVDVMVEAKAKELSILPFINSNKCEYSGLLNTSSYE